VIGRLGLQEEHRLFGPGLYSIVSILHKTSNYMPDNGLPDRQAPSSRACCDEVISLLLRAPSQQQTLLSRHVRSCCRHS